MARFRRRGCVTWHGSMTLLGVAANQGWRIVARGGSVHEFLGYTRCPGDRVRRYCGLVAVSCACRVFRDGQRVVHTASVHSSAAGWRHLARVAARGNRTRGASGLVQPACGLGLDATMAKRRPFDDDGVKWMLTGPSPLGSARWLKATDRRRGTPKGADRGTKGHSTT